MRSQYLPATNGYQRHHRGFVLLLVLVATALLSFAVYAFSSLMATSAAANRTSLQQLQRRQIAESALALAAAEFRNNSEATFSQPVVLELPDGTQSLMAILPAMPEDKSQPVFGFQNESAKLNLNSLPVQPSRRQQARRRLAVLPGVTPQIADAIMDWLDPDDEPSENGAEAAWYLAQSPPRLPGNGPFRDLHELLLVRGITSELLYGEDSNGNGLLDPTEDDGNDSMPPDNSDGVLQAGLSEFLTTLSAESSTESGDTTRIWINSPNLPQLFDQIQARFGSEAALYLTAGRLMGINWLDDVRPDQGQDQDVRRLERLEQAAERLNSQLGLAAAGDSDSTSSGTRAGLQLNRKPVFRFRSHIDLFGGQVRITKAGKDQLLESPWPADAATMERMLPEFQRIFSLEENAVVAGRININQATEPVLASLPGLSESQARAIRVLQPGRESSPQQQGFETVAWLVARGVLTPGELRAIAPLITTGGGVVSGIAVAQIRGSPAAAAIQFMCDFTGTRPGILWIRDLPVLPAADFGLTQNSQIRWK
jgi:type II secretory pathway component PulK